MGNWLFSPSKPIPTSAPTRWVRTVGNNPTVAPSRSPRHGSPSHTPTLEPSIAPTHHRKSQEPSVAPTHQLPTIEPTHFHSKSSFPTVSPTFLLNDIDRDHHCHPTHKPTTLNMERSSNLQHTFGGIYIVVSLVVFLIIFIFRKQMFGKVNSNKRPTDLYLQMELPIINTDQRNSYYQAIPNDTNDS